MKRILAASILALLAGCASESSIDSGRHHGPETERPVDHPERSADHSPQVLRDTCGKSALDGLIGQLRTQIPVPVDPSRRRVICTTCAMTQDFRPERLTILFDAETGVIRELRCG